MNHHHELESMMSAVDWLTVYNESINEYGLDMEMMIKETRHPEKYLEEFNNYGSQLNLLNDKFDSDMTWEDYANYSGFLKGLTEEMQFVASDNDSQEYINRLQ